MQSFDLHAASLTTIAAAGECRNPKKRLPITGGYLFGEKPGADNQKKFFSLNKQVTDQRVKPAGEWNTLEITAVGKVLALWVNGGVTCQFEGCGREKGYLGLEGEGYRIEFRNLKVKTLR